MIERMVPLRRAGSGDDIAWMVAFLCSDQGSWITGQLYTVDGGTLPGREEGRSRRPQSPMSMMTLPSAPRLVTDAQRLGSLLEREVVTDHRLQQPGVVPTEQLLEVFAVRRPGSTRADAPYATPTIDTDFSRIRLSPMDGMSPAANPTTR